MKCPGACGTGSRCLVGLAVCAAVLAAPSAAQAARLHVAVFNFQMKTDTPGWVWLQKGLADRITTDFTRSRRITVVARDEMQRLAREMRWVPEMARTNAKAMGRIRKELKLDRLVTGVYRVADGRVTITAQIVEVESRTELARKEVSGPVEEVLALQKRLSAELLGHFSGVAADRIEGALPVWTRSIAATKALYEGLHLYDQGRYAEAWLRFRQAQRSDPSYLEAHYWVARMYYFMDRYRHARRAYERFVYMDAAHPRIGDAIKEYLHTYEKLGAEPETLLALYEKFRERFADVPVYNEMGPGPPVPGRAWLQTRSAQILHELGQHRRACELASEASAAVRPVRTPGADWAFRVALRSAQTHHALTGEVTAPPGLRERFRPAEHGGFLRFSPERPERNLAFSRPVECSSFPYRGRTWYRADTRNTLLLAPDGYAFRHVSVYPELAGDLTSAQHEQLLMSRYWNDLGALAPADDGDPAASGCHSEDLPPLGILRHVAGLYPRSSARRPDLRIRSCRIRAELERIPAEHGAILAVASNGSDVAVRVDGRLFRTRTGLAGPVAAGRHTVEYRPTEGYPPYAPVAPEGWMLPDEATLRRVLDDDFHWGRWRIEDEWIVGARKRGDCAPGCHLSLRGPWPSDLEIRGVLDVRKPGQDTYLRILWNAPSQCIRTKATFWPARAFVRLAGDAPQEQTTTKVDFARPLPFCLRVRGDRAALFLRFGTKPDLTAQGLRGRGPGIEIIGGWLEEDTEIRLGQLRVRHLPKDTKLDAPVRLPAAPKDGTAEGEQPW